MTGGVRSSHPLFTENAKAHRVIRVVAKPAALRRQLATQAPGLNCLSSTPCRPEKPLMTLRELLTLLYQWADAHALAVLLAAIFWGLGGTLLARIAKGGHSDRDGRLIASVVIGGAALMLVAALLAAGVAHVAFNKGLLDANALLLLVPLVCVLASVLGIHRVFPLSELASVRTLGDLAGFALACIVLLWLLSKFRGWGVAFLGGLGSLALIGLLAMLLLRVLYRRAFRSGR